MSTAQLRNRGEGVTGLLIYDKGCFYQWLEGPTEGLTRIWDSIRRDQRHHTVEILREQNMPNRFFGSWDMRLAHRPRGRIDGALATIDAPDELLARLGSRPSVLAEDAWDRLFAEVVMPNLRLKHSLPMVRTRAARQAIVPLSTAARAAWHAHDDSAAELGGLLLAVDAGGTARYIDGLMHEGASLDALFHEVFEPAARWLGGLWDDDLCNDFNLTLGLGRLQVEVRRVGANTERRGQIGGAGHAVLVAPQPGETHGLGASLSSEMFFREGWDVSCEFPNSDQGLRDLVHERWFDVLDLSLSGALRRDHRLQAMGVTIRAAQAASMNPALAIIVDGRSFVEQPHAYLDVGADIGCLTSIDAVVSAQRLVDALALRNNPIVRLAQVVHPMRPIGRAMGSMKACGKRTSFAGF